jgi:hypothetical protein
MTGRCVLVAHEDSLRPLAVREDSCRSVLWVRLASWSASRAVLGSRGTGRAIAAVLGETGATRLRHGPERPPVRAPSG